MCRYWVRKTKEQHAPVRTISVAYAATDSSHFYRSQLINMAISKMTRLSAVLALLALVLGSVALPTKGLMPFPRSMWDINVLDDPFRSMLLDQSDPFSLSLPLPKRLRGRDSSTALLASADWKETPTGHVITVDIPGIKKENVKVEVEEESRVLRVSGERKAEKEEKGGGDKWHRVERTCGMFWREFRMPRDADVNKVKASLEDGVLRITVPKDVAAAETKRQAKVIDIVEEEKDQPSVEAVTDEM